MRLENKQAIVTGGAGGIGRATSLALAAEGAAVAVVDLNAEAAEAVAAEIREAGGTAIAIAADVSSETDIERVVAHDRRRVRRRQRRLQQRRHHPPHHRRRDDGRGVGPGLRRQRARRSSSCASTSCRSWRRRGGGSIVNTGSGWGLKGGGRAISYCASKGAVVNMTRALAIDHGPQGIRVNSVNPGDVNTGMLRDEARQLSQDADAFLAEAADRPLRRMGEPREIAAAVVWLASDESSYVTGSALVVDGGGIA